MDERPGVFDGLHRHPVADDRKVGGAGGLVPETSGDLAGQLPAAGRERREIAGLLDDPGGFEPLFGEPGEQRLERRVPAEFGQVEHGPGRQTEGGAAATPGSPPCSFFLRKSSKML